MHALGVQTRGKVAHKAIRAVSGAFTNEVIRNHPALGIHADERPHVAKLAAFIAGAKVFLFLADESPNLVTLNFRAGKAALLLGAFAEVGIIALVDEATGYQYDRARDALARILKKFIAKELQPWTRAFPLEFYKEIFHLRKWPFDPATMQSPRVLGKYTNNIVYARLAPGVLDELRKKSHDAQGRKKHKYYKWLTGDIGHPRLVAHLEGVKIIMRESNSWEEFLQKLDRHYPTIETTELGFDVELTS